MSDLANYLEAAVQEWWADGQAFPNAPDNIYVGLHTGVPGNDAGSNEVDAGDYERLETSSADWDVLSGDGPTVVENSNELEFSDADNNWGDISHASLWDAQSDGNPLWQGELNDTRTIDEGDRLVFPSGDFEASLD